MSDLSFLEKRVLEKRFGMSNGFVLDFSNRTFRECVVDSTGKDIYDPKYNYASGSKANRLRAFWKEEPNAVVGKLLKDLLSYSSGPNADQETTAQCNRIAQRLIDGTADRPIDSNASTASPAARPAIKKD